MMAFMLICFAVAALVGTAPIYGPWVYRAVQVRIPPSMEASALSDLLRGDPDGWTAPDGRHVLRHADAKLNIWIANEDYGLKWWTGDIHDWGGAATPSKVDRAHIYRALKFQRERASTGVAEAAREALANIPVNRRVTGTLKVPRRASVMVRHGFKDNIVMMRGNGDGSPT